MRAFIVIASLACVALPAAAQTTPSITAGQSVPIGRRVLLSENVRYVVDGAALTLRVSNIFQAHLSEGGWLSSADVDLTEGTASTRLSMGIRSGQSSVSQTWNGWTFTVFVIHHTGGMEIRVDRRGTATGPRRP